MGAASFPLNNSSRRNELEVHSAVSWREGEGGADVRVVEWRAFACLLAGVSVGRRLYVYDRWAGRPRSVVAGTAGHQEGWRVGSAA